MSGLGLDGLLPISLALHDTILVGLGHRLGPVDSVAALRATPCKSSSGGAGFVFLDYQLMYVGAQPSGQTYRWAQSSTAADDGSDVIKPADAPTNGRWLKISSAIRWPKNTYGGIDGLALHQVQHGYLRQVILHTGDFNEPTLQVRIYAQAPCIAINWIGEDHAEQSQLQGVLLDVDATFQLWIASRNYRGGLEAVAQPIAEDAAVDPGPTILYGLAKQLLAGARLDLVGVKQTRILRGRPQMIDESATRFVFSLDVKVQAAEHQENAASDISAATEIQVARSFVELGEQAAYDEGNVITGGLDCSVGLGLLQAIAAGTAIVGGLEVSYAGELHTFGAASETYRDLLPNGSLVFVAVLRGAAAPDVTATALRVGVTTTDDTGVVADRFIAATNVPYPAAGSTDIVSLT